MIAIRTLTKKYNEIFFIELAIFLSLALTLTPFPTHTHAGGVFWTDRGASALKKTSFDGSTSQTIALTGAVSSPGSNIRGIAIDSSTHQLYWADNGSDRLLTATFQGSESRILVAITGANSFPADVRLDLTHRHLYWCDQLRNRIQRSALDGSQIIDVLRDAAPTGPYFLDIDPSSGKLYWGDFGDGRIYRANLDGSARETLLTGNNSTRGVRVDPRENMLYWVNRDDKKIHRCPLAAFNQGTIPLSHPAVQTLYSSLDTPHGLVLDLQARKLYWADTGTNAGNGQGERAISRGDFDGSTSQEMIVTGTEPWDVDLDLVCSSYQEWTHRFFRRDAPSASTAPDSDPDQDGSVNWIEYALGQSPTDGTPPTGLTTHIRPDALELTFQRRSTVTDVEYLVETSTDLLLWAESARQEPHSWTLESTSPRDEGMEQVVYRLDAELIQTPHVFTRLRLKRR